ncbi:hypothetical protein, partial [[Kitasatospora] papulosa]|uniref:hypothetical protein n=1 Tax=[Kitasatospora] papulosa TaxID=1464011 RepID=UPI0036D16F5D
MQLEPHVLFGGAQPEVHGVPRPGSQALQFGLRGMALLRQPFLDVQLDEEVVVAARSEVSRPGSLGWALLTSVSASPLQGLGV